MSHKLSQHLSRLWRAIIEFDMLEDNDKILIGLSGGKDSMFLTYAMSIIAKHSPRKFSLAAFTIDPMFTDDFATEKIAAFCESIGVPFYSEQVNINQIIKQSKQNDPCYTCSFFRRGATNRFALKHGFNKIALAHHHDDAVETFFMSLFNSGQLKTFLPKTYLDRTGLTVIRPLIYYRETDIINIVNKTGIKPLKSPCPIDGHTNRQVVKDMIKDMNKNNPALYDHLASAMRESPSTELWPEKLSNEQLKIKFNAFRKKI